MEAAEIELPSYKDEWREFVEGVAISGAKYAASGKEPAIRRLIWTALILVGFGIMSYQLIERTAFFFTYPTNTLVLRRYPEQFAFPTVTICNENRFSLEKVKNIGLDGLFQAMFPPFYIYTAPIDFSPLKQFENMSIDWKYAYGNLSYDMIDEGILNYCVFDSTDCRTSRMWKPVWTDMGYCFQFNPDGELKVTQPGFVNGLSIRMDARQHDYLASNHMEAAGFRALAHEPGEIPDILMKGTHLGTGETTSAVIHRTHIRTLTPPYGQCNSSVRLRYSPTYSVDGCFYECRIIYVVDTCGCLPYPAFDLMKSTGLPACDPEQEIQCANTAFAVFYLNRHNDNCDCPQPCETIEYNLQLSSAVLNERALTFISTLASAPLNLVKLNVVTANIYFASVSYTEIIQEKDYDIFTLFCDMGGALGLLLGSTFLTVYEFIDFLIFTSIKRMRRKPDMKRLQKPPL